MNNPIPRKPRIIHNNMKLPIPKLGRLLHQPLDIPIVEYIPDNRNGLSAVRGDGLCDCICFSYTSPLLASTCASCNTGGQRGRTAINISNNNSSTLVRELARDLGADALAAAGDDSGFVGQKASGIV